MHVNYSSSCQTNRWLKKMKKKRERDEVEVVGTASECMLMYVRAYVDVREKIKSLSCEAYDARIVYGFYSLYYF